MKLQHCTLCPKACGADRTRTAGWCGGGAEMRAARAALHFWEEPCISGKGGAGAVFFSGCALRCCFCQNRQISQEWFGKAISVSQLSEILLRLQEQGAETLDLVTGSHYAPWIAESLQQVKPQLHIPVVWNSSGYDSPEILSLLDGLVDVYLPDWKYVDNATAEQYSGIPDYCNVTEQASSEMVRQVGQYTPPETPLPDRHLNRRLTTMEYQSVLKVAQELELEGFSQDLTSARKTYIPSFSLEGLDEPSQKT